MCFSASASFSAAAIIGTASVFTLKMSWQNNYRYFGCIPLLFAIQQLAEGCLWLNLTTQIGVQYQAYLTALFLFFAWSVWPFLIPLSMYQIEHSESKKKFLKAITILGAFTAMVSVYHIVNNNPIAYISSFHIDYKLGLPVQKNTLSIAQKIIYIVCTLVPLFISSATRMKLFAFANTLSLLLAFVFFENALPSTWCFFAAILSLLIYHIIKQNQVTETTI